MDKDKRKKSVKDSLKSRIASMNRATASPKMIVNEAYAIAQKKMQGGIRTLSDKDIENIIENIKNRSSKKGKPHLKKGGTIKTYAKGGGVRKVNN